MERNLHCDVVHITTVWVSSLTLGCNGVFAIKACTSQSYLYDCDLLDLDLDLDLRDTGRTLHRYHAWVCGFRSGVTLPELLIMLS